MRIQTEHGLSFLAILHKSAEALSPRRFLNTSRDSVDGTPTKNLMQISRHDHHNLEIKSVIEFAAEPQKVTTEVFLYFPKSFEIGLIGKAELTKDFRTRLRLSIPTPHGFEDENFSIAVSNLKRANTRFELESIASAAMGAEVSTDLREGILEASKDLAAIVAERLKRFSYEHGREFFVSQSLLSTPTSRANGFDQLAKNLQTVRRKIETMRDAMRSRTEEGRQLNDLLDEYTSQLYVQYLGAVHFEFQQFESELRHTPDSNDHEEPGRRGSTINGAAGCESTRLRVQQLLIALQEDEAVYRKSRSWSFDSETEIQRERHLMRLSQLKKFFQSKTFVEVTKKQAAKRISESTALLGTAIAAITAAIIEQFGRQSVATIASQGLIVVGFGVILYVLRDRMKDWAREKIQAKAMMLVPDFETTLVANKKRFGMSREWLHILNSKQVDAEIAEARHADTLIERDLRLPEDVLYLRRLFFLDPGFESAEQTRSLHENIRLNFDRHLKFMDDPFKDLTDLEADGRLVLSRSHRVYHFHLVTRTTFLTGRFARPSRFRVWKNSMLVLLGAKPKLPNPDRTEIRVHRVVLDKSGIVRVEPC